MRSQTSKSKTPNKGAHGPPPDTRQQQTDDRIYALANEASKMPESKDYSSVRETRLEKEDLSKKDTSRLKDKYDYLENDKTALSKRLSMVLMELDKVSAEKTDMDRQLADHITKSSFIQEKLSKNESAAKSTNASLESELKHEREISGELKAHIEKDDMVKRELMVKLRAQQSTADQIAIEIKAIKSSLSDKQAEIEALSSAYQRTKARTKDSGEEVANSENTITGLQIEQDKFKEELHKLESERNSLIDKMNDLTKKYEIYVQTMAQERADLAKMTQKQLKLISAKILAERLAVLSKRSFYTAMLNLKNVLHIESLKTHMTERMAYLLSIFRLFKLRDAFQKLETILLNWPKEKLVQQQVLGKIVNDHEKQSAFSLWRACFRESKKAEKDKNSGAQRIAEFLMRNKKQQVESAYLKIKSEALIAAKKATHLRVVLTQKHLSQVKLSFEVWKVGVRKARQRIALEFLTRDLAKSQVLQTAFIKLKDAIRQSRADKLVIKYRVFRFWENAHRINKQKEQARKIADIVSKKSENNLKRMMMHALMQHKESTILEKRSQQLNEANERHSSLKGGQEKTNSEIDTAQKKRAINAMVNACRNRMFYFLSKWRQVGEDYKRGMKKLKLLVVTVYKNKLGGAMGKWRKFAIKKEIGINEEELEKQKQAIEDKGGEKIDKERAGEEEEKKQNKRGGDKLKKVMLSYLDQYTRYYIRKWKTNALAIQRADKKLAKFCQRFAKINLYKALTRWQGQSSEIAQARFSERRIQEISQKRISRFLSRCLAKLKKFSKIRKLSKRIIHREINHNERIDAKQGFQTWLRAIRSSKIQEEAEHQELLSKANNDLVKSSASLAEVLEKKEKDLKARKDLIKWNLVKVIWNIVVRRHKEEKIKAFIKWGKLLNERRRRFRILQKSLLSICQMGSLRSGLHKWQNIIRVMATNDKKAKVKEAIETMAIKKKKSKLDVATKETEKSQFDAFIERAKKSAAKSHDYRERICGYLIGKKDANVFMPLKQAILRRWHAVVEKEKKLSEILMRYAKRHSMEFVMIKVKNAALEEQEKKEKLQAFKKLLMNSKKSLCKDVWDKWLNRCYEGKKGEIAEEMKESENQISAANEDVKKLKKTLYKNADTIIKEKLKNKAFHGWMEAVFQKKLFVDTAQTFGKNKKYIQTKRAIQRWKQRLIATQKSKFKLVKSISFNNSNLKRAVIRALYRITKTTRTLPKVLSKIQSSFAHNHIIRTLTQLKRYEKSKAITSTHNQASSAVQLGIVTARLVSVRLIQYLGLLGSHSKVLESRVDKLARVLVAISLKRIRYAFHMLHRRKEHKELEETIEIQGDQANTVDNYKAGIKEMEQLLTLEGFGKEELQADVKALMNDRESLVKKALGRWQAYQAPEADLLDLLTKWKNLTNERKDKRKGLATLCHILGEVPLNKSFNRWRKYIVKEKEKYRGKPKDELIEEALIHQKQVAALNDENAELERAKTKVTAKNTDLAEKKEKSKFLGIQFLTKLNNLALMRSLSRWRSNARKILIALHRIDLAKKENLIAEFKEANKAIARKNKSLKKESETLGKLSLESIQLAKALKELNKQKEQLSVDLADRAVSIRKLLEDNKNLKEKLERAQAEAAKGANIMNKGSVPSVVKKRYEMEAEKEY